MKGRGGGLTEGGGGGAYQFSSPEKGDVLEGGTYLRRGWGLNRGFTVYEKGKKKDTRKEGGNVDTSATEVKSTQNFGPPSAIRSSILD